jgi:predicted transcriptional regulator
MKRRSEELIIYQILDICSSSAGKTKIVYQANLNSKRVDFYLSNLIKNGLVAKETHGSKARYKTTYKGLQIKEKLHRLQNDMEELGTYLFNAEAKAT